MLSLLFQKSLSRSLEGQRERGENREIQEETRTASPAGAEGTRRDVGPLGAHRGWGLEGLLLQRKKGRRAYGRCSLGQAS